MSSAVLLVLGASKKPLVVFVMVVKNEAGSIVETVKSVRDHVDRYLIYDTGSTDGTEKLAKDAFGAVQGRIVKGTFVDFGTTRNAALDEAGTEVCSRSICMALVFTREMVYGVNPCCR